MVSPRLVRPRAAAVVAVALCLAGALAVLAQEADPPLRPDELRIDIRPPLARSADGLKQVLAAHAQFRAEVDRLNDESNPAEQQSFELAIRRHARALVKASRAHAGTDAALAGKLLLPRVLSSTTTTADAVREIWSEVQRDFDGWPDVVARMGEAVSLAPTAGATPERADSAIRIAESAVAAASPAVAIEPADRPLLEALGLREPLGAEALLLVASLRYNSSFPRETPAFDRARLESARTALLELRSEHDEFARRNEREIADFLGTIETILGREPLR